MTAAIRYAATPAGLFQALTDLGNTPERVAEALRVGGFRGHVCSERTCPVANYLASLYPDMKVFVTGVDAVLLIPDGSSSVKENLPGAVRRFVDRFDLTETFADLAVGGAR